MWATIGDDLTGHTREDYYTDTEGETNLLNIHVENMYWWDKYALNGQQSTYYEKYLHNYEVDGGSRGCLLYTSINMFGNTPLIR